MFSNSKIYFFSFLSATESHNFPDCSGVGQNIIGINIHTVDTIGFLLKGPLSTRNKQIKMLQSINYCQLKPPHGDKNKITNTTRRQGEH